MMVDGRKWVWVWVCVGFFFHNSNRFNFFASFFVWGYFRNFFAKSFLLFQNSSFPHRLQYILHTVHCILLSLEHASPAFFGAFSHILVNCWAFSPLPGYSTV